MHLVEFCNLWSSVNRFSTSSAYKAQFIGSTRTDLDWVIWNNRLWTADRLAARNWPHNALCVLCGHALETGLHLFMACHFSRVVWSKVAQWVDAEALEPANWGLQDSVLCWWTALAKSPGRNSKGMRSLLILVAWAFCPQILNGIKADAKLWVCAGAKHLAEFVNSGR
ncbi:hypothetical protein PVAP13_6NG144403 [Panicum virgatum]|uniref:Reverse transcriptase zinc-binding domain-containing protein n=1 Tax=Panicum virgatum TaxID=38727 RepID=A0A8T0R1L4_PANVG|nr:hypothetical protein PVAP13_6NG144403 [Panicum virgatum]